MVHCWEPGVQYNSGDVVEYEGSHYRIIQPHRSQSDWSPPIVPALWGKIPGGYQGGQSHQQSAPQQPYQQQSPQPPSSSSHGSQQGNEKHDGKKDGKVNFFGLEVDKSKLAIGGGLLAGATVLGGGFAAYKHHEKKKEHESQSAWALNAWLEEAKVRTANFYKCGPSGPATWILAQNKHIPPDALLAGHEGGRNLYICRSYHEGGIQVGKASQTFEGGGLIGFKHHEISVDTYEVLVADPNAVKWVSASGKVNVANLGSRPVEGGRENDGTLLYIARAPYKEDGVHPGKASAVLDGAYIPWGGTEKNVKEYQILCYN